MTPDAQLRIGSVEVLAALAVFGIVAARVRPSTAPIRPPVHAATVSLTVHEPPARGGRREQDVAVRPGAPVTIGRSSTATVGILDPDVSRTHAKLALERGLLFVADAGSSNGTFLNGKRVDARGIEVRAGDVIDVGTTRITVNGVAFT